MVSVAPVDSAPWCLRDVFILSRLRVVTSAQRERERERQRQRDRDIICDIDLIRSL